MATALLVIDVQQSLVDELDPQRRTAFLQTLVDLIGRARRAGTPILYVRHGDEELRPNTAEWEIANEVAPQPSEPVVEKTHWDAFRGTNLHEALSRLGIDHVVLCGMQTEFCIDATMREADRRGYQVTLAGDAHATYPVEGATEEQIRAQVHRVARGTVAKIVPSAQLFVEHAAPNALA